MAPSGISSLGVGSGLDLGSLLDNLRSSEQAQLRPLRVKQNSFQTQLSAYGKIKDGLTNLRDAIDALGESSLYEGVKVSTPSEAFSAEGSDKAVAGSYDVQITQLAQAQSLAASPVASTSDPIGAGGTVTLSLGDGNGNTSKSVDITLSSEQSTLSGIRDAINDADIGISASIINDGSAGSAYHLTLSAQDSGDQSQISVSANDAAAGGSALSDLLDYSSATDSGNLSEKLAAQNATLTVNGIGVTSQSNTVEDAIQGVTLSLSDTTTQSETLSASPDDQSIKDGLSDFVDAYNRVQNTTDRLSAFNGPDSNNGVLLGDSTTRQVENQLRGALNTPVSGGSFSGLPQVGVSLQKDGTLAIDEEKLDAALTDDRQGVAQLLTGGENGEGVSGVLASTLTRLAGDNGLVQAASDSTQTSIDNLGDRIERTQDSIDTRLERQRKEFVQLDSIVASLNNTKSYLTTQLSQLNGSSGSGGGGGGGLF